MIPIKCTNAVDSETQPSNFEWIEECVAPDDRIPDHTGCQCSGATCVRGACPCASSTLDTDEQGRLIVLPAREPAALEITECGESCSCAGSCGLGFSGGAPGLRQPALHLHKSAGKGWGVVADEPLPAGALICEYAGEFISSGEAGQRLRQYDAAGSGHALLVLREWLPSGTAAVRINIDATRRGNLGRFFNHSCDGGNLRLILGRRTGSLLPRVLFVTSRPVQQGEELCYSYGPANSGPHGKPCFCGAAECQGFMPHEDV